MWQLPLSSAQGSREMSSHWKDMWEMSQKEPLPQKVSCERGTRSHRQRTWTVCCRQRWSDRRLLFRRHRLPRCGCMVCFTETQRVSCQFKIDIGADMTTIGRSVYDSMRRPPPLEAPDRTLRCMGGTLHCDGMFDAYVRRRDTVYKFRVAVIPESPCLLGRSVSEQMGLVQRMNSLEYPTPSWKMHMRTDEVNISLKEGHTLYCAAPLQHHETHDGPTKVWYRMGVGVGSTTGGGFCESQGPTMLSPSPVLL